MIVSILAGSIGSLPPLNSRISLPRTTLGYTDVGYLLALST